MTVFVEVFVEICFYSNIIIVSSNNYCVLRVLKRIQIV